MLSNPAVAHGAQVVNASGTFGEDDHPQRDNASDQRHRCSYPEHSALSTVKRSPSSRFTIPLVTLSISRSTHRQIRGRSDCCPHVPAMPTLKPFDITTDELDSVA